MKLKAICPQCQSSLIIPAKLAGRSVKCSACQHLFKIRAVQTPSQQSIESGLQVDAPAEFSEVVKQSASTPSSERSTERGDAKVADAKRAAKKHSATQEQPADAPSSTANADTPEKSNSTGVAVENKTTSAPQRKKPAAQGDALTDSAIPAERPIEQSVSNGKKPTDANEEETAIGRFKIEEILGSGGFGDVYRAFDPLLDRHAALKVLRAKATTEERRERMLREAKASARLRHPNIVAVYEVGEDKARSFIASQFIPGTTLADHLKQIDHSGTDPETLRAFVVWLIELSGALAYAHRESIIHRDVKPHNVLIDEESHAQLADFGLAHQIVAEADTTRQLVGTPAYMSPEQVEGDLSKISPASDQYAVGVILFEGLVGRRPFEGDSISLLSSIVHDEVPKPTDLKSTVPLPLEQICLKAMSRDASDRYGDCDELADDLQRWLDGELVLAANPSWVAHSLHWAKKRPHLAGWLAALAATFLMLGGTTITLGLVKLNSAATELTASREEFDQSKVELKEVRLESDRQARQLETQIARKKTAEYARKLDGGTRVIEANDLAMIHRMLDRVPWKDRGIEHSLLRRRAMGTPIILHSGEPIRHLSWSHDGTLLAAVTDQGDIRFWDGIHHTPLTVAKVDNMAIAEFHPSRMELISLHNREYDRKTRKWTKAIVRKWRVARDGDQIRLSRSTENESDVNGFRSLAFHPSGRLFAVCGDGRVEIRDLQDGLGVKRAPKNIRGNVLDVAYSADGQRLECLVTNGSDTRRLIIDEKHPDGLQAWVDSPRTPPLAMDPSVVTVQPRLDPIDRVYPNPTYFRGKVLSIDEAPVNSGSLDQPTCAIELAAGHYFRGYSDGHVMEGSVSRVGHLAEIGAAARRPDLACVATGDRSGEIRIWPTTSRTPEGARCAFAKKGSVPDYQLVSNFDGTLLSTNSGGSVVTVWQTNDGKVAFELDGHAPGTHAVDFHPERNEVLTVDGEGVCRIWDLVPSNQGTRVLRSWRVEAGVPHFACFDSSGENILIFGSRFSEAKDAGAVGFARVVSAADGTSVCELQGLRGFPIAGAFVPESDSVIVSCDDKTIASYSSLTGERIADFETDGLVAIDLDVTSDQLVAVLAEPCALNWNSNGQSSYRSQLRSWQIETANKMFDVGEPGVSYRFVDVDATLGRILVPAGDGYRIHDLATGERLWTDYRYPASYQIDMTREQTYQVCVPYTEQVEQSYTVQVPVMTEVAETYTVATPMMATEVLKGTRSPDAPNTIVEALEGLDQRRLKVILKGQVRRTKGGESGELIGCDQVKRGVFLKSDKQGNIQLFSDSSLSQRIKLPPVEAEESVALEVVFADLKSEERERMVPVTKMATEERTRTVTVTKSRMETRTRTVPVAKVIPTATAKGSAIFLPGGRGLAVGQFDAAYVVSAAIPSSPRELVASDCHYEMLATDAEGTLVAAAGQSGSCGACGCNDIDIWQTDDGEPVRTIRLSGASAGAINFDPRTGNLLVGISCFGASANANNRPVAAGRDEIPRPVPEGEDGEALAYEGATLLVIDPRSGEIVEQRQGPESIIRIATSIDGENPIVLLVNQENQVYRLNDDGVIQAQPIRCGDAGSVSVSEDGKLVTYKDPDGRYIVALTSALEKRVRLPAPWAHAHFSWGGKELVARKLAQPTDAMTSNQELVTMSWKTDQMVEILSQPSPPAELPPGTTSGDGWVLPAMKTTLVQSKGGGTSEFRPLHTHSTLKEFHSTRRTAEPVFRGGKVFSIGNPYETRWGQPKTHNHVITWDRDDAAKSITNASIPFEPTELLARKGAVISGDPVAIRAPRQAQQPADPSPEVSQDVWITSVKGPVYQTSPGKVFIYAPPKKRFEIDVMVHHKSPEPVKLAANLRLSPKRTDILSAEVLAWLKENHGDTQHFDTQSRGGYTDVVGEGQLAFKLVGKTPEASGIFPVDGDVGLYDKKTWRVITQRPMQFILVTDREKWNARSLRSYSAQQLKKESKPEEKRATASVHKPTLVTPEFIGPESLDDFELSKLSTYAAIADKAAFEKTFQNRVERLQRERSYLKSKKLIGHIVVGRVELEGEDDVALIRAQNTLAKDGSFLFLVETLNRPIGFRLHQYEPVDVKLSECTGKVVDVGTVKMRRLPPSDLRFLTGKIVLEGSDDPSLAKISLEVGLPPINSIRGSIPAMPAMRPTLNQYEVQPGGKVSVSGLSPTAYYGKVEAPGYMYRIIRPDMSKSAEVDFGQATLEKAKNVRIEYVVAKTNEAFDFSSVQTASARAGGSFRAPSHGKIVEINQKDGGVQFDPAWAKDQMLDLAVGKLMDFQNVDRNPEKWGAVYRRPVEVGHVYLLRQSKIHALFRVVAID